jgi:hypothetical protein
MHLPVHGQWWSNSNTHTLQSWQWMARGGRRTLQWVHKVILGPGLPGTHTGASKSGSRGGMMPGSLQAAKVKARITEAELIEPTTRAHAPNAAQTSLMKKNVGVQINA